MAMLFLAVVMAFTLIPDARAARTIDVGDHLQISVLGAPEFNRLLKVRDDGTVPYPYITEIPVVGMTTTEMQTLLVTILRRYMDNPVVVVEIPENYTVNVQVLGQVRQPGLVQIPVNTDVQSAISLAGGPADHADPSGVHILRPTGTDASGETEWKRIDANLREFLASGDLKDLPKLQEDDIIIVPSITNNSSVMVVGWVNKPGNYVPYADSNVLNMVLLAGGFRPDADRSNIMHLFQVSPGVYRETELDLDEIIADAQIAQIPPVSGGDVIIVSLYDPFFTWDRMLDLLRDVSVIASAYLIYLRIDRLDNN
ncbi:polysaccharide export protein [bacterium]|nr:polysaccharide export protein [bacterium]